MARTIEINGVDFELFVPRKNIECVNDVKRRLERYVHRSIWQCYERPSETKEDSYRMWLDWARCCGDVSYFGVSGYNSNFYSLQGLYFDGAFYYELRITACHNKAFMLTAN